MSESERQDVIPICKTFHTSAHTLSQRYNLVEVQDTGTERWPEMN